VIGKEETGRVDEVIVEAVILKPERMQMRLLFFISLYFLNAAPHGKRAS
jgi:hypothetical protein